MTNSTAIKERPILFSGEMVRAILDGRKTQTRRVVKPQFDKTWGRGVRRGDDAYSVHVDIMEDSGEWKWIKCPYGKPGDRLWVRENGWEPPETTPYMIQMGADTWPNYMYDADGGDDGEWCKENGWKRRPSIHMPRWASRLTLEVTEVRVERVQEISEEDANAEGIVCKWIQRGPAGDLSQRCDRYGNTATKLFEQLWDSINGTKHPWASNPWVWVVSFKRVEP